MNLSPARYAVKEANTEHGCSMFWNFTAWRFDFPERLLDADAAKRELVRLQASRPHAAERLEIVDVVAARARTARFGQITRALLAAAGYDALPKGPSKAAVGQAIVQLAKVVQAAEDEAAALEASQAQRDHDAAAAIDAELLDGFGPAA